MTHAALGFVGRRRHPAMASYSARAKTSGAPELIAVISSSRGITEVPSSVFVETRRVVDHAMPGAPSAAIHAGNSCATCGFVAKIRTQRDRPTAQSDDDRDDFLRFLLRPPKWTATSQPRAAKPSASARPMRAPRR